MSVRMGMADALRALAGGITEGDREARVLELRVHGVNNTSAQALLDVSDGDVEQVAGDKLGSFWRVKPDAVPARGRGSIPDGITREAYSWGGMVRTTPNLGSAGAGLVAAGAARIVYALILPFALANAVQWTRSLNTRAAADPRAGVTAGLSRLFSLVLTLLFVATAATAALDMVAGQCAPTPARCAPIADLISPLETWTAGQRVALLSLLPVLALLGLWLMSTLSRVRYDVLPGMAQQVETMPSASRDARRTSGATTPALSLTGFWANRVTGDLAMCHGAAGITLTAILALEAVGAGRTVWTGVLFWSGVVLGALTAVLAMLVPTGTLRLDTGSHPLARAAHIAALTMLLLGAAYFATTAVTLVFGAPDDGTASAGGRDVSHTLLIALVTAGGLLAASGVFWRPWARRRSIAWWGMGPAVFMTVSLALAAAVSAIAVVTVRGLIQTRPDAADPATVVDGLVIPDAYPAIGTAILLAVVVLIVIVIAAALRPRDVGTRAHDWGRPAVPDELDVTAGGVLPPSKKYLFGRIEAKRGFAARMHLIEPVLGTAAVLLAAALVVGTAWAWSATGLDVGLADALEGTWLAGILPSTALDILLVVSVPALGWIGATLVAALTTGAATGGERPLGIVWDVVCYLPRTGHPFGPPCYAERAVPEIAGRLYAWLEEPGRRDRRAVLSAHSMGAVLAVSALGLLASDAGTRGVLRRIGLLTFGVQLRAYFGRMLPDLLGPDVLGTVPARGPGLFARDPWAADALSATPPGGEDAVGHALVGPQRVRWTNLWRLTDHLGFPARAPEPTGNGTDVYAEELDRSGYMVEVETHHEYYRVPRYTAELESIRDELRDLPDTP